ncbi:uncharacterized protein LOC122391534 isoform X2 [Amphibalanus amphitrite]|uniref:uncharacterized protein LOC122391534 isoform X2 n=1 Tax=Amphibalanus amphitrite TaxID=1232801 RepID=UPI001C8FEF29|nr:uncharacterized protein LOC122391534 isoform X2 [Amphibalanus amphitrite]
MADLFPDIRLFDELEFLRFSDEQFASEVILPEDSDTQQTPLFSAATRKSTMSQSDFINSPSSSPRTLTELKSVVASCTVGIYRSPEPEANDVRFEPVADKEKTLNEMVAASSDRDALGRAISWSYDSAEEADVTSPVSFSAISERSAEEAGMELIQSSEVSQTETASPMEDAPMVKHPKERKLKVLRKPASTQSPVHTYSKLDAALCKRKLSVTDESSGIARFKTTRKTKKYMQKPYTDPNLERTRLNAINAKKNRDRKKQEMMMLSEKCNNLSQENRELDRSKRSLEARLHAAEEEIAFLRRALLDQVGHARPALGDALKSLGGGDSAPAG